MGQTSEGSPDLVTIDLPSDEVETLQNVVEAVYPATLDLSEATMMDYYAGLGHELRSHLPVLAEVVDEFSTHTSWKAVVLHLNTPDDLELGPTPIEYLTPEQNPHLKQDAFRAITLGVADGWYGYGYTSQQPGNIHNNVIAVKGYYDLEGISANPHHELGLHTEDASYNLGEGYNISPDILTLDFLRNPTGVPTMLSMPNIDGVGIHNRTILERAWFANRTNPGQGGADNDVDIPVGIVYGNNPEHPWLRINTANLGPGPHTAEEAHAMYELLHQIKLGTIDLELGPGDLLLIDNRRTLHGRRKYGPNQEPKLDGTDRWQRRLVVSQDAGRIATYEAAPRIVDPGLLFAAARTALRDTVSVVV